MSYRLEQTKNGADIVIDGWEHGIADSPYATTSPTALGPVQTTGLSDMRNMNIISIPTEASVNFKTQPIQQAAISAVAFSASTAGVFTYTGAAVHNGTKIVLNTLSGGTASLSGITMTGTSTSIFAETAYVTTGSARIVISSNNLSSTNAVIKIGFVSNASNGDAIAVVVNGTVVPIQFVSAIGAVAGNVLIGATTADTIANLLGLLQNPATTSATQVATTPTGQAYFLYFTSASGTPTVGLSTTSAYWAQNATATTFTLTGGAPSGTAVIINNLVQVPASATGTFSTAQSIGLLTQIVPNSDNTIYYAVDTNGLVWAYNLATSTNWIYMGNTATAAATPDFNTGVAYWNGYIFVLYDGPSGYQLYTRPTTEPTTTTITADAVAATDILTITTPTTTAAGGVVSAIPIIYTAPTHGGLVINTTYFAGAITATTFKLYHDIGLTSLVDITVDTAGITFTLLPTSFGAWTAFKTLINGAVPHRTFTDKNNTLYWCDGKQIGSLIQLTTFSPSNSATYTYSAAALLIQANDKAQCMEQLGTNLIIGGIYNQNYVWDRFSTGYTPLFLPENNCHRMVTVNSNTYMFVGNRGRIYITNGSNAQLYKKVPDHLSNTIEPYL